jgi:UDP-GlcNAc:undecaprenyl-phosphate GlcNAc-1-phosphate transferase
VGGLGVLAGIVAGIWLLPGHHDAYITAIWAGSVLVATGVWDDIREASFAVRFFAQAFAVALLAWIADVSLLDLGYIFNTDHSLAVGRWGVALTIFAAVGVINAVNMSDGLDGLAGGLSLVTCTALLLAAQAAGNYHYVPFLGVVMAALIGFMLYNVRIPGLGAARLYLGDAGSLLIGFLLAWLLIAMTQDGGRVMAPVTALWIFALPLFDAVASLLRRPLQGRSPFHADRAHYHHYLRECGLGVNQTLIVSVMIASLLAGIGLIAEQKGIPEHVMFYAFLGVFVLYLLLMLYLDTNIGRLAALRTEKNGDRIESPETRSV